MVNQLKKPHLDEIRSLQKPPPIIILTLASVVILNTDRIKEVGSIIMRNVEG